ncbi:WGxxGxxG family protein [Anabaena sp. PCC 7108]|uniref:WGxxGxxG family protein n=1 Tax=Anabaena sp. PCC 7108 TaxID=163908 RepID=UPI00034B6BDF|nr:WGxxGxxG family protein [Anabaena sp. PCC 7108]
MKSNFTKTLGVGILTLMMGILPLNLPAQAQVTQPRTDVVPNRNVYYDDRNDFDWGWLGLIGLLGLAGLAGKRREEQPTAYRDPNAPGATSYRD